MASSAPSPPRRQPRAPLAHRPACSTRHDTSMQAGRQAGTPPRRPRHTKADTSQGHSPCLTRPSRPGLRWAAHPEAAATPNTGRRALIHMCPAATLVCPAAPPAHTLTAPPTCDVAVHLGGQEALAAHAGQAQDAVQRLAQARARGGQGQGRQLGLGPRQLEGLVGHLAQHLGERGGEQRGDIWMKHGWGAGSSRGCRHQRAPMQQAPALPPACCKEGHVYVAACACDSAGRQCTHALLCSMWVEG